MARRRRSSWFERGKQDNKLPCESLKGKRAGQRSIRLSQAYRAIYKILKDGKIQFIEIIEVNKHDY
jgi:plasmid maintenance system killer protein